MAYEHNYKFWVATAKEINDVVLKQSVYEKLKPIEDRFTAHCIFADMYVEYLELVNRLGYIYHRTFQVKKREMIEKLLEASSKRLLELREELKKIELNEFIYIDRALIQRKLIPYDIQLIRPVYFPYWRSSEIQNLIKNPRPQPAKELTEEEKEVQAKKVRIAALFHIEEKAISIEEQHIKNAIILIQSHERLRIGRIWQTNIRYNPKTYLPRPQEVLSTMKYNYTHKPAQSMLVPVRRTKYSYNYFIKKKKLQDFNYYVKPPNTLLSKTEEKDDDDDDSHKISIESFKSQVEITESVDNNVLDKVVAERSVVSVEDYYLDGLNSRPNVMGSLSVVIEGKEKDFLDNVVRKIQGAWKIYKARQKLRNLALQRKILYGMATERKFKVNPLNKIHEENDYHMQKVQKFKEDFAKAIDDERNRILRVKSPWIMEDISDQIRAWFREFYDAVEDFHPYPDELVGGTILLLLCNTMSVPEYRAAKNKKPLSKEEKQKLAEKRRQEKAKFKEKIKKEKLAEKKFLEAIAARGGVYYDFKKDFQKNFQINQIKDTMKEYEEKWRDVDEKNNITEAPFIQWISEEKFEEIHKELRVTVDALMRIEFEQLRQALAQDKKKKYKPQKVKKPKKAKGKGKKKKEEKDLTKDRTIDSIYYEMEDAGLIRHFPKSCFEEFIGDFNYCAYELRNYFQLDVQPSTLEVRDILREWIMGMGPLNLPKYRAICIAGPPQSGKIQLSEILASEIDAVIIDLSPENVLKYENDLPYLTHLVTKMSKILQPTIILIDNVHRVFWKKVPKELQELRPQLLQKILLKKIIKPIKNEDKIFVLGTTDEPWAAKPKMKKIFDKILLLPKTDYSSSFILWKTMCLKHSGVPRDFEFSALAWVGKTYSTGKIAQNIANTLSIERRMKLARKTLRSEEFIEKFLEVDEFPPDEEEFDKFIKWYNKTNPLAKQRVKYMKVLEEEKSKKKK